MILTWRRYPRDVYKRQSFSFAQNDIDHVLRLGGNTDRQRERVVADVYKRQVIDFTAKLFDLSPKEAAEKLAQDFGLIYDLSLIHI